MGIPAIQAGPYGKMYFYRWREARVEWPREARVRIVEMYLIGRVAGRVGLARTCVVLLNMGQHPQLDSMVNRSGSVFYQPFWIFYISDDDLCID